MSNTEPILQFFRFEHLPPTLQTVSAAFHLLAHDLVRNLPDNIERAEALRKLLEAKDCAVRARLFKPEPPQPSFGPQGVTYAGDLPGLGGGGSSRTFGTNDCPAHDTRCTLERCHLDTPAGRAETERLYRNYGVAGPALGGGGGA